MSAAWWLRQTRSSVDPAALTATRVMAERGGTERLRRLRATAWDALRQRARPSRPSMRAVVLHPGGRLAFHGVPAPPAPGPLGAVVHPVAMATCDMDRPIARGQTPFPTPMRFGHECVAEVLSVGQDVEGVRPGDLVVVPFQISCGRCRPCTAGHTANCLAVPPLSMYGFGFTGGHWGGTLADELAVPFADGMLVPLPAGVDPVAAASVADNVSDAYRHVGPFVPVERMVILAALRRSSPYTPSVPLYTGLIARALGVRDVVFADARPSVRHKAEALGLTAVEPEALRPAPLVADISAEARGLARALALTEPDGICTSSGILGAHARIPTLLMYAHNVTLHFARTHARALIPEVLDLIASGRLAPERVNSVVAPLDDAVEVLSAHVRGGSVKTILAA